MSSVPGVCVILYANDILLIAPSVCSLEAVKACEFELDKLDIGPSSQHIKSLLLTYRPPE